MSDQQPGPVDQGNPQQQPQANPPANQGELQARLNGAIQKIQELTLSNRDLTAQLTQKTSEIEQLKAQIGLKDVEKVAAVGERDKQLNDALQKVQQLEKSNADLQGLALKLKVAKELKRPELINILDRIPSLTDETVLRDVMNDFIGFADGLVKEREKQILAGYTPDLGPGGVSKPGPADERQWQDKINSLPLGSPERAKAFNDYGDWLEARAKIR